MENSFKDLIEFIEAQTAFKCHRYKEKPLKRRIRVRMRALNLLDFSEYQSHLRNNPDEVKKLLDALTINLSYFFRNPEAFDYLRNFILPDLKKKRKQLTFWSAGCAHGEEPYSLAIISSESAILQRVQIYGTDIDMTALETARKGIYPSFAFQYTPKNIVSKYFRRIDDGLMISEKIKDRVAFSNHDLFEKASFAPCDLIMCRNVMIYLDRAAQSVILQNFHDQLKSGGYLVIGKVELLIGIPEVKLFETVSRVEHVYRKKEV